MIQTLACQVSGEDAIIQAAASNGWIQGDRVMRENLKAFKRVGCGRVLTSFASRVAKLLREGR
jgi:porphobilinogen synthase